MILRSSSTPILGSLVSSSSSTALHHFVESPTNAHHPVTCHFSPTSHEADHGAAVGGGLRRAQSVDNLFTVGDNTDHHCGHHHPSVKCSSHRRSGASRAAVPPKYGPAVLPEEEEGQEEVEELGELIGNHDTVKQSLGLKSELPLFLARGLGIDRLGSELMNIGGSFFDFGNCGSGNGRNGGCSVSTGSSGERSDLEMHYKKMVEEDPSNALFLRNYAQFLYQVRGDLRRAEEYYSRAILSDPADGDILSEYATLVWELHGDEERACSYFEQAARASPQNSHVHAAYAAFLWDAEEDDHRSQNRERCAGVPALHGTLESAAAT